MNGKKIRVLVVPLNWGLGHCTRLIPCIRELLKAGMEVIISGSDSHKKLFRDEFGDMEELSIPCLKIKLSEKRSQVPAISKQLPQFLLQIWKEHRALKHLIRKHKIDIVISDSCFGLWNKSIYSVFITHQLHIKMPERIRFLEKPVNFLNHYFAGKFNECWIPDEEENGGYAGELSHPGTNRFKIRYIGIQSRFSVKLNEKTPQNGKKHILFIISGPEKQRSVFEDLIRQQVKRLNSSYRYTVVQGLPESSISSTGNFIPHAKSDDLRKLIVNADMIICRAGYSTIMDLIALGKNAVLVPTPGQTEQEYLALYLRQKGIFHSCAQESFDLKQIIEKHESEFPAVPSHIPGKSLTNAVKELRDIV